MVIQNTLSLSSRIEKLLLESLNFAFCPAFQRIYIFFCNMTFIYTTYNYTLNDYILFQKSSTRVRILYFKIIIFLSTSLQHGYACYTLKWLYFHTRSLQHGYAFWMLFEITLLLEAVSLSSRMWLRTKMYILQFWTIIFHNILAYLIKAKTVESEIQSLLVNGFE
jgi:hypothetical protein